MKFAEQKDGRLGYQTKKSRRTSKRNGRVEQLNYKKEGIRILTQIEAGHANL